MVTNRHKRLVFLYLNNIFTSEKQAKGATHTHHTHDRLNNDLSQNSFVSPLCNVSHAINWNINHEAANLKLSPSQFIASGEEGACKADQEKLKAHN